MYSQTFVIPASGKTRLVGFGGEPYDAEGKMTGYNCPSRVGVVVFKTNVIDAPIRACRASVHGYEGTIIDDVAMPNNVFTEFPCSVEITGPAGTSLTVEGWQTFSTGADRGGKRSHTLTVSPSSFTVPMWAQSVDVLGPSASTLNFYADLAETQFIASIAVATHAIGLSIPDGALVARLTGPTVAPVCLVFRQR